MQSKHQLENKVRFMACLKEKKIKLPKGLLMDIFNKADLVGDIYLLTKPITFIHYNRDNNSIEKATITKDQILEAMPYKNESVRIFKTQDEAFEFLIKKNNIFLGDFVNVSFFKGFLSITLPLILKARPVNNELNPVNNNYMIFNKLFIKEIVTLDFSKLEMILKELNPDKNFILNLKGRLLTEIAPLVSLDLEPVLDNIDFNSLGKENPEESSFYCNTF